ncbi:MAG: type II secretion system protein [Butyrivibrio crossotus]|nr:type II secretion system protein [Butyrivibrio crossotus]MBS6453303.1 type II secretion system protein [Butyrivibrio sp.]
MIFMKKMSQKNNKGFSLVELIVVVAIMAVLMGILVPTLVKNVEKSKKQKDASAIEEIRSTMVTTLADPTYSDIEATIIYDGTTIDVDTPKSISAVKPITDTEVKTFLTAVSADVKDWKFTSKAYKADDEVTFVISGQMVTVYREAEGESAPGAGGAGATTTVAP